MVKVQLEGSLIVGQVFYGDGLAVFARNKGGKGGVIFSVRGWIAAREIKYSAISGFGL